MIFVSRIPFLVFLTCTVSLSGVEDSPLLIDLPRVIAMAISESQQLKKSRFELNLIRMYQALDFQPYLPSFSFSFSDSGSVIHRGKDKENTAIRISLKQALLQGGRGIYIRRLRKIETLEALNKINRTIHELMVECYSSYYKYLFEQQKIRLRKDALESANRQWEISKTEYKLGKIREIDLLSIELEVRETKIDLEQQQTKFKESAYRISRLVGLDSERTFKIAGEPPENYQGLNLAGKTDELIRKMLNSSPRVQSELLNLKKNQVQKKMALLKGLPDLSLNASVLFTGDGFPLQHAKYEMDIELSLPLPFFSIGGALSLNSSLRKSYGETRNFSTRFPGNISYPIDLKKASNTLSHSLWSYQDTQKELERLVRQSVERYERGRESLGISSDRVDVQRQRMEIILKGIEIGSSTRLEYLKVRSNYLEQVLKLLEETLSLMLAERTLELQTGFSFRFFDEWERLE